MKYWLATHRVDLHKKHGNFIGCRLNSNGPKGLGACSTNFRKMSKGDKVVVCSRSGDLIFGVYEIISGAFTLVDDPEWGTSYCFKTCLELERDPHPSFKEFKDEFKDRLDFVGDNGSWEGSSVGWIRELSENDFELFNTYIAMPV
jgi:hypothetical protein